MSGAHSFHGLEIAVRSVSGARALRIVHPPGQVIPAHRHDWPLLTLPALGSYEEECDDGSITIDGPAAVLHPAGTCHANCIHCAGMETFSLEFDPAWLGIGASAAVFERSFYCLGGEVPLASRALMRLWADPQASEARLRAVTAGLLSRMISQPQRTAPPWLAAARAQLACSKQIGVSEIAHRLGMHPRWLAHAYRTAVGEGVHETLRRRRIEAAVQMLRSTDDPIAEIAFAAGFCDQSHLNRALRRLTGRTPVQIRGEREQLKTLLAN
jgi:AraC family transcriptional regulator